MQQKRVATIHDISGFGKCSLTVAVPIISSTGIETAVIPTALLSTHTGGIDGFTYKDLTDEILPIAKHWKSLNIKFDAIYTGFLGSFEQIEIVCNVFDILKTNNTMIIVDPCMADNGKLYKTYTKEMAENMISLCAKANVIVPNITEACILLDIPYRENFNKCELHKITKDLTKIGCDNVVLTGVSFAQDEIGALCYSKKSKQIDYIHAKKIPALYHGTGDIFASFMTACLLNGINLKASAQVAANFTSKSIDETYKSKTDRRFGVNFESQLLDFAKQVKDICPIKNEF